MTSPNSHPILKTLKDMWIQVRTFLTDLCQGLFLVVYLGIRLLPLLVSLALEKLFSLLLSSRTSLMLTLMVIVYILTLKPLLTSLYFAIRGFVLNRVLVVNVVAVEDFHSKALRAVYIYLKHLQMYANLVCLC